MAIFKLATTIDNDDIDKDWNINLEDDGIDDIDSKYLADSSIHEFFKLDDRTAINLLHANCRSLSKNFSKLSTLFNLISGKITAIAVTETWLTESNSDIFNFPGYEFVSKSRTSKNAGGVGIYVDNSHEYIIRDDLCLMLPHIECIFIELVLRGVPNVILGCVYRPPNTDATTFNTDFLSLLNVISTGTDKKKLSLIAGDFNLDLLKHESHHNTGEFLQNLLTHSYLPSIRKPTRITDDTATLIDNIFVRCNKFYYDAAIFCNDVSDHLPIAIHLKYIIPIPAFNSTKKRKFDSTKNDEFKLLLSNIDWNAVIDPCLLNSDPSKAYDIFYAEFKRIFDNIFPYQIIKNSYRMTPRHEWITPGIMKSCITKSQLYKKYLSNKSPANKAKYNKYSNKLKSVIQNAEKKFYELKFIAAAGNIKQTWKILGQVLKNKQRHNLPDAFFIDNVLSQNTHEIANKFNEYFTNVGSNLAAKIPNSKVSQTEFLTDPINNTFALFLTDPGEIINISDTLNNKTSFGHDEIPVDIMKVAIRQIASIMSKLINSSFTNGLYPTALKIGKICPVFKAGDKKTFSNYRPISILSSFSKIYEKAVANRLTKFLDINNIITDSQFGFRKNHSPYMALLEMYNNITAALDTGKFSIGIYIDLSKAFDTLNHDILCQKLSHYGIRGMALDWIRSYLYLRKQCVYINSITSSLMTIDCGVPQGSILGPLLFIIYINDIVKSSTILSFSLFADDTSLVASHKNLTCLKSIVNTELLRISEWFKVNRLSLNIVKTNYIIFGNRHINTRIKF